MSTQGQDPNKVYFSAANDPNEWPETRSFWCPVWLQPAVFWVLRKLNR